MTTIKFETDVEWKKLLDSLQNISASKLPHALEITANQFGILVRNAARSAVAVDTGELMRSITYDIDEIEGGISLEIGPTKSYGKDIEFGRPAGTYVSPQALSRWAAKRGLNPYAVSRSIMKKGSPAQPFLFPAFDGVEPRLIELFAKALESVFDLD